MEKGLRVSLILIAIVIVLSIVYYYVPSPNFSPEIRKGLESAQREGVKSNNVISQIQSGTLGQAGSVGGEDVGGIECENDIPHECSAGVDRCGGCYVGCPGGEECVNGCCVSGLACTDSDGGINANQKGRVEKIVNNQVVEVGRDSCFNAQMVHEAYCSGADIAYQDINCAAGVNCVDGKCYVPNPTYDCVPQPVSSWGANLEDSGNMSDGFVHDEVDGNVGVMIGGDLVGEGKVGNGFVFDGVNDYIEVQDADNLDVDSMTIEGWIKPELGVNESGIVLAKGNYYRFFVRNDGTRLQAICQIYHPDVGYTQETTIFPISSLGEWSHVACTYDGGQRFIRVYFNGRAGGSHVVSVENFSLVDNNESVYIGGGAGLVTSFPADDSPYFEGAIDEVSFYNYALSDDQINLIYQEGKDMWCIPDYSCYDSDEENDITVKGYTEWTLPGGSHRIVNDVCNLVYGDGASSYVDECLGEDCYVFDTYCQLDPPNIEGAIQTFCPQGCSDGVCLSQPECYQDIPLSSYVSWWKAEGNGYDSFDGNDGVLMNGVGFTSGKVGQAFRFDGFDNYIRISPRPNLNLSSITVEGWIKPNNELMSGSEYQKIMVRSGSGGSSRNILDMIPNSIDGDGKNLLRCAFGGYASAYVAVGNWTYFACTYDSASGRAEIYLDGSLSQFASGAPGAIEWPDGDLLIGSSAYNISQYYDGLIDELTIFNKPLTAQEIQGIYQAGSAGKCISI